MRSIWVYPVVALTLSATALFIAHLRLGEIPDPAVGTSPHPPTMGRLPERTVEYRVDGPPGVPVFAAYLDVDGTVREVSATLPWQTTLRTRQLTVPTGVMAQTQDGSLSCRIAIDGRTRDTQESATPAVACKVAAS